MEPTASVHTLDEHSILAELRHPIEIQMMGRGASGYLWTIGFDKEKVRVVDHSYVPNVEMFGASGKESFLLEPIATGDTKITFALSAPWGKKPAEIHTIELVIGA